MKIIAPDYYKDFTCIADKCRHSCCIGWEIDVDSDTFNYYKSVSVDFGKRLMQNISVSENTYCFKLTDNERCPFLNDNNLCDIIINLGEDKLCKICADHPRYRNFFSGHTETGLGLCCEEAAHLILSRKEKTTLITLNDDGRSEQYDEYEERFFSFRDKLFEIITDRTKPLINRVSDVLNFCGISFAAKTPQKWADIYMSFEILDKMWSGKLAGLRALTKVPSIPLPPELETAAEQLLIYFIYRHTADSLYDGRLKERAAFAVHALYIIYSLCAAENRLCLTDFIDVARMYSTEIEYSQKNINSLLEIL